MNNIMTQILNSSLFFLYFENKEILTIIPLITAPVEPAPIEPEVETFRDTAEVTEVKTEGTFYTNILLTLISSYLQTFFPMWYEHFTRKTFR